MILLEMEMMFQFFLTALQLSQEIVIDIMPTIYLKDDDFLEKQKLKDELLKYCATMVVKSNKE